MSRVEQLQELGPLTGRPHVRADRGEVLALRMRAGRWHAGAIGALAVLLGATSMQPLLDGGWWLPRTLVVVLVITVVGGVARTWDLPAPLHPVLQFSALLVSLAMLFARDEARWGILPGPASLARLRDIAAQGRDLAVSTVPPAEASPGLLLLIVAGVGLAALVVDTLAAGLDLPGMTLIPLTALFAVPWVIQRGSAPGWTFVLVAVGWLAVVSALQGDRVRLWSRGARAGSPGSGLAIAVVTTILAVLAGGLTGLRGTESALGVGPGSGFGSGSGTVHLDALVSLRRSLIENDDRTLITMQTTAARPDYLRTAILEDFNGEEWSETSRTVTGPRPPPEPEGESSVSRRAVEYRLQVGPLSGTTLPSPDGSFAARSDARVSWDQHTSLPLHADGSSIEDTRITLSALQLDRTTEGLRAASTAPITPGQVNSWNLADPGPLVGDEPELLAREITQGAGTPFDAAVALQRWFTTDGGFTYSNQVVGSDTDALAEFLSERVGYCEQFAATMALMARSIGIPARVVLGFTQGQYDGTEWVVRGIDAHAWPELWMGSAGWIRFEPTTGAATSTTPSYSTAGQASAEPGASPTQGSAAPSQSSSRAPGRVPEDDQAAGAAQDVGGGRALSRIAPVLVLVLLLVPAIVRVVRRRRRISRGDGESAYMEVIDTLVDLRLGEQAQTPRVTMSRVRGLIESADPNDSAAAASAVDRILHAVEWQRYGRPGHPPVPGRAPASTLVQGVAEPPDSLHERITGVAVAERAGGPAGSPARAGALTADLRSVRQGLAHRAGRMRRTVAVMAPRSLLAPRVGDVPRAGDGPPGR